MTKKIRVNDEYIMLLLDKEDEKKLGGIIDRLEANGGFPVLCKRTILVGVTRLVVSASKTKSVSRRKYVKDGTVKIWSVDSVLQLPREPDVHLKEKEDLLACLARSAQKLLKNEFFALDTESELTNHLKKSVTSKGYTILQGLKASRGGNYVQATTFEDDDFKTKNVPTPIRFTREAKFFPDLIIQRPHVQVELKSVSKSTRPLRSQNFAKDFRRVREGYADCFIVCLSTTDIEQLEKLADGMCWAARTVTHREEERSVYLFTARPMFSSLSSAWICNNGE